jgi:hypothetical protein
MSGFGKVAVLMGGVRRSVEQGSAQRGAGTRSRDATVQPITGVELRRRSAARLRGQIPKGAPLPPFDAPQRSWGCDRGVAPGRPSETAREGTSRE